MSQGSGQGGTIAFCALVTLLAATEEWSRLEKWKIDGVWLVPAVAVDKSPVVARIRSRLAAHEVSEARRLGELLILEDPKSYEGYFWAGFIEQVDNRLYRSVRHLRKAEKLQPPGNAVQTILGLAYCRLEQRILCEMKIREAVILDPEDFAAHYLLGHYMQYVKDSPTRAVERYGRALELRSDEYLVLYDVGTSYETARKQPEARAYIEKAIAIAGREGRTLSLPYQALSRLTRDNDPKASLEFATRVVELEAESPGNQLELAKAYTRLGRLEEAVNALKAAISLDSAQARSYYRLFNLYRRLGEKARAEQASAGFERRKVRYERE